MRGPVDPAEGQHWSGGCDVNAEHWWGGPLPLRERLQPARQPDQDLSAARAVGRRAACLHT